MEEYVSNSNKSKQEKRKVEKVVTDKAVVKKKTGGQKLADVFISEDISSVKTYILMDVLVPSLKKAIVDIVTNGINMLINGRTYSGSSPSGSKVSYGSYYNSGRKEVAPRRTRSDFDYDNIIFRSRGDAEAVLQAMDDMIAQYKIVTVGDLYDLADVTTDNYMVNRYGWTDVRIGEAVRVPDGYVLKLPKPMPLD